LYYQAFERTKLLDPTVHFVLEIHILFATIESLRDKQFSRIKNVTRTWRNRP